MTAAAIIDSLEKLSGLYERLNSLAEEKRDILKKNETEALKKLIMEEQVLLKAASQADIEREAAVERFLLEKGASVPHANISGLQHLLEPEEASLLEDRKARLMQQIAALKDANELNQQLIYQSLQFINVSLDLFRPNTENFTYERTAQEPTRGTRGLFDSKA